MCQPVRSELGRKTVGKGMSCDFGGAKNGVKKSGNCCFCCSCHVLLFYYYRM